MNMYNIKYYSLLALYYVSMIVRGLLLIVFKPLGFAFAAVESILSEWTPSKPLHKSDGDDIDYDKHLGI